MHVCVLPWKVQLSCPWRARKVLNCSNQHLKLFGRLDLKDPWKRKKVLQRRTRKNSGLEVHSTADSDASSRSLLPSCPFCQSLAWQALSREQVLQRERERENIPRAFRAHAFESRVWQTQAKFLLRVTGLQSVFFPRKGQQSLLSKSQFLAKNSSSQNSVHTSLEEHLPPSSSKKTTRDWTLETPSLRDLKWQDGRRYTVCVLSIV